MLKILENIEFGNFKKYLENEYGNDAPCFEFAITKIDFNCNQLKPKLEIEVSHFKSPKKLSSHFIIFFFILFQMKVTVYISATNLLKVSQ